MFLYVLLLKHNPVPGPGSWSLFPGSWFLLTGSEFLVSDLWVPGPGVLFIVSGS